VGKAPGHYNLHLGGGYHGDRLNKVWKASVSEDEILELLKPLIKRYALERQEGEKFGDFVSFENLYCLANFIKTIRAGLIKPVTAGLNFWEGVNFGDED
jgi:sulfite reductase (NADPH) hemoprotein beta-component